MSMNATTAFNEFIVAYNAERLSVSLPALTAQQETDLAPLFNAIWSTMVNHITTNAVVATTLTIPIGGGDAGLQSFADEPTNPPLEATALDGTGTGTIS